MMASVLSRKLTSVPAPCLLILSREHGKQNLWVITEGHCTKWVSSRRSLQRVHLKLLFVGGGSNVELPERAPGGLVASPLSLWRPPDERLRDSPR